MDWQEMLARTDLKEWILLGGFLLAFFIQLYYYLGIYTRMIRYRLKSERTRKRQAVSVIICARNEAEQLRKFLPAILRQDYPSYEVVVVNDGSEDESEEILAAFAAEHPHLRFTNLPDRGPRPGGKKLALTLGLKSAANDLVLLTDADCYPASDNWLKYMVSHLKDEKEIVLGYGAYERRKGLLNALIRYDTVFTAMQYFSFALKGKAYMGVGRNLAYRKALFFKGEGFSSHYHVATGDDDLFINQHATGRNTAIEIEKESHTISMPKTSFAAWVRQKRRHLGAGKHYRKGSLWRLGLETASRILLYALFIVLCFSPLWRWPVMALFLLHLLIKTFIFKLGMIRLNEKYLLLPSLLFDPVLPLILGLIWIRGLRTNHYQPWS
jgi:cellulose synthase/poly-beta-1,6-N-acetylglucosamine synthase-like glycosyltransferase